MEKIAFVPRRRKLLMGVVPLSICLVFALSLALQSKILGAISFYGFGEGYAEMERVVGFGVIAIICVVSANLFGHFLSNRPIATADVNGLTVKGTLIPWSEYRGIRVASFSVNFLPVRQVEVLGRRSVTVPYMYLPDGPAKFAEKLALYAQEALAAQSSADDSVTVKGASSNDIPKTKFSKKTTDATRDANRRPASAAAVGSASKAARVRAQRVTRKHANSNERGPHLSEATLADAMIRPRRPIIVPRRHVVA